MAEQSVDMFLELTGPKGKIEGDCIDKNFKDMIEIDDFELSARSMGAKQSDRDQEEDEAEAEDTGTRRGGKKKKKDKGRGGAKDKKKKHKKSDDQGAFTFKITKETDKSSADLALSYSRNLRSASECFPKGMLYIRKRGTENFVFATIAFENMYVVNYQLSMSGGKSATATTIPEEDIEFVFEKCGIKYHQQDKKGQKMSPVIVTWNFKDPPSGAPDLESALNK